MEHNAWRYRIIQWKDGLVNVECLKHRKDKKYFVFTDIELENIRKITKLTGFKRYNQFIEKHNLSVEENWL